MIRLTYLFFFIVITGHSMAQRLVLPGDFPDPSVVKIGNSYWASATTSNWMPAYPMLQSSDLKNWKTVSHVFTELPAWADYYFWAPEVTYDNGKVYIYYSAHKKGGNLCVGIASADKPEGPYKDHGPLICEEAGSIDAFPMRDENGKLHIIWKEDGNSVGKPTPIWMQALNEERTALLGEKKLLFSNEAPWEGNLIEGVSMLRHGSYMYAFYAAAGCCGKGCTYQSGIARSKSLAGPWEKYANNPVLVNEENWTCPGHGTPVEKDGKYYFLYHAYDSTSNVYAGRQGILKEFVFTDDNWIKFVDEAVALPPQQFRVQDKFKGSTLRNDWQWSVFEPAKFEVKQGMLHLNTTKESTNYVGQKTLVANYEASVKIDRKKSTAFTGISLIGDEKNYLAAFLKGTNIEVVQTKNGKDSTIYKTTVPNGKKMYLTLHVENGKDIRFYYGKNRRSKKQLNKVFINGAYLPPWDRALRVALMVKGTGSGVFDGFEMKATQ